MRDTILIWHILRFQSHNNLRLESVGSNTSSYLHQKDDSQQHSEGEGHAVVFFDGAAASEESHEEDDATNNDEEDRGGEELVSEEVKILTVGSLHHSSSHDQKQSWQLKNIWWESAAS